MLLIIRLDLVIGIHKGLIGSMVGQEYLEAMKGQAYNGEQTWNDYFKEQAVEGNHHKGDGYGSVKNIGFTFRGTLFRGTDYGLLSQIGRSPAPDDHKCYRRPTPCGGRKFWKE